MKFVLLFLLLATATTSAAQSQRTQQDKRGLGIRPQTEKTADTRSKSKQTATKLPELVIQSGHTAQVTALAFSPDGNLAGHRKLGQHGQSLACFFCGAHV